MDGSCLNFTFPRNKKVPLNKTNLGNRQDDFVRASQKSKVISRIGIFLVFDENGLALILVARSLQVKFWTLSLQNEAQSFLLSMLKLGFLEGNFTTLINLHFSLFLNNFLQSLLILMTIFKSPVPTKIKYFFCGF